MTQASTSDPAPSTDTRSGPSPVVALLAMLGLVAGITVAALALGSTTPAAAVGLVRFESCDAIEGWADTAVDVAVARDGALSPTEGPAVEDSGNEGGAPTPSADESGGDGETGGTNTVVEGVDEVDVIDRLSADRLLAAINGTLLLIDLPSRQVVASLAGLPVDARISVDDGVVFAAGSRADGLGAEVQRVRVSGDALVAEGTWTTTGYLLDARRSGGRLHVVAVDQPFAGGIPFPDGPVACDQVWRPVAPATTPAATLVASFAPDGPMEPVAATEVAGTAGTILVTHTALYVATESWAADEVTTGLHRFALTSLEPTGSGVVPGTVAGPFAMSEYEGNLRVATHLGGGGGFVGRPMPVDDVGLEVEAPAPTDDEIVGLVGAAAQGPDDTTTTVPEETTTTVPEETTTTVPEETTTTVPEETTTTTEVETTTTSSTSTTSSTLPAPPAPADALAEVFVLDLDGTLDVVGRTGRFGHDFETIHGVRFVGDTAYVVTFLQTDPFWVIDLAEPTTPRVVGELQIPGFSGYLHPAGEGRVVGFGPDGSGAVSARLFDVSDPAAPSVLDDIRLGDDSPVVFDHHAFVSLGEDRFAVPVTDYPTGYVDDGNCLPTEGTIVPDVTVPTGGGEGDDPGIDRPCELIPIGGGAGAAVLSIAGGRMSLVQRDLVTGIDVYAERVILAPDGTWLVLGYGRLIGTDGVEVDLLAG